MQVMTLNIWGGHVYMPLIDFIKRHQHIDVFCFQEVYHDAPHKISTEERTHCLTIFQEIADLLPDHQGFFRPVVNNSYGIGMFVKNTLSLIDEGEICIHHNPDYPGKGPTHTRILQWIQCQISTQPYIIINVHGLWNGQGKTDSPERLQQSATIKSFIDTLETPVIVCGDFNLRPDTQSLALLEEDLINLNRVHQIQSTRTSWYSKEEKFADYILVSKNLNVDHFSVLPDEVSDHAPLLLRLRENA
jgi:endonuclease/exonuclease/phosphatase family metal-dependent hydrolase